MSMTDKTCRYCGNPVPRARAEFCNRECFAAYHATLPKACIQCGAPIPRRPRSTIGKAKFCGNDCKLAYQRRHPPRPRHERTVSPCATCGKPVGYLPSQKRPGQAIYCSRRCFGKGHSKLMTGRRPSNGTYTSRNTFRAMIRREFRDECAVCGWAEAPCDVAHIVSRRGGGEDTLENVTMLCPNHHRLYDSGLISETLIRETRAQVLRHA